jgi:hypothetical protein
MEGSVLEVLVALAAVAGIIAAIPTIEHYARRTIRAVKRRRRQTVRIGKESGAELPRLPPPSSSGKSPQLSRSIAGSLPRRA